MSSTFLQIVEFIWAFRLSGKKIDIWKKDGAYFFGEKVR